MKTWTQFKSQLVSEAIIPKNHNYGFMGTAQDPHKMLDQAVAHVKKAAKTVPHFKMSDETIGHYLDSVGGRHLADHMNYKSHPDEIHKSLSRHIKEFSKTYNPNMFESFNDDGSRIIESTLFPVKEPASKDGKKVYADYINARHTKNDHSTHLSYAKKSGNSSKEQHHSKQLAYWSTKVDQLEKEVRSHLAIHESDPHLSAVHAAAMSTVGKVAAAKRRVADAKAREEYLAKKAGKTVDTSPKVMPTPVAKDAPKKHGILHTNQAKSMEHWSKVRKILDKPLPAKVASEKLAPHTDDQRLHTDLHHFAKSNPDVDMRPLVKKHLERIRKTG